jgi:hypothetical protein
LRSVKSSPESSAHTDCVDEQICTCHRGKSQPSSLQSETGLTAIHLAEKTRAQLQADFPWTYSTGRSLMERDSQNLKAPGSKRCAHAPIDDEMDVIRTWVESDGTTGLTRDGVMVPWWNDSF